MPFETGFDEIDEASEIKDKEFDDILEHEELTVERFQKMERRIMGMGVLVSVLVLAVAGFMGLNFMTRLTQVMDTGEVKVNGLSKDVEVKVGVLTDELGAAEAKLKKQLADIEEKAEKTSLLLGQTVKALEKIKTLKIDRARAVELLKAEHDLTADLIHKARVKTDRAEGKVTAKFDKEVIKLQGAIDASGSEVTGLARKVAAANRSVETMGETIGSMRAGISSVRADLAAMAKIKADLAALEKQEAALNETIQAGEAGLKRDIAAGDAQQRTAMNEAVESLKKRIGKLENSSSVSIPSIPKTAKPEDIIPDVPVAAPEKPKPVIPSKPAPVETKPSESPGPGITEQDLGA